MWNYDKTGKLIVKHCDWAYDLKKEHGNWKNAINFIETCKKDKIEYLMNGNDVEVCELLLHYVKVLDFMYYNANADERGQKLTLKYKL